MTQDATPPTRAPRWIKVVLGVSLALNLAIGGLVAGAMLRGGPPKGPGAGLGYAMPYIAALPRDTRRDVFGALRRDGDLPRRSERRAAYDEMIAALRATPFDAQAIAGILDRQADGVARVQLRAQAAWIAAVQAMSAPQRAAYAQRIEEVLARRGRGTKDARR